MALNQTQAKKLLTVGGRSKYTEETKDKACLWLIENQDKGATLKSAAEKFGMSTQTLSAYRQAQLIEHGLVESAE